MGSRVVRSLVLASSLLLALPQGWCCILANQMARVARPRIGTPPIPEKAGCCECCTPDTQPKSAATEKPSVPPTEKPSAPPAKRCCLDRHALLSPTSSVERPGADLALVLLPPSDPSHSLVGAV